jgi:hypothetical protein
MHRDEETTLVCDYLLIESLEDGSTRLEAPECDEPPSEDPARKLVLVNRTGERRAMSVDMTDEVDRHRLARMVQSGVMS